MDNKQRLNRKIVGIIILVFGIIIIMCSCTPHKAACPTYYSNAKAKQLKKKSAFEAWTSDFCQVKKKKYKKSH